MADIEILELEDFALELAHTAGGIAQAHFRRPVTVENKSATAFDPVTNADRAIERVLRTAIVERYPEHGIVAEEEGERAGKGEYTWFIDPIDGTRSFMTGSPLWGTLIGLTRRDQPLFGLLVQPVLEEVFLGGPSGSWLIKAERRDRLKSRGCKTLAKAMLGCTHPDMFTGERATAFRALSGQCLLTRFGGDCYNYAMVAAGYLDLVVESQLKPYDIVPLIPILEGAGCLVTDWHGKPPLRGGDVVVAGSRELHKAALAALRVA
ncbi:MAG TPA: inositol monophosphatase family protein [Gammaproteobacteria bacterium]|nr:inositol monophosphatase family protein [Gammaproteobacteria bacterium]